MKYTDLDFRTGEIPSEGTGELSFMVTSADDFASDLNIELESIADLDAQVFPTGAQKQVAGLLVYVDDVLVPRAIHAGDTSVTRDYDNLNQGWTFSIWLTTPEGTYGGPFQCFGPGLGKRRIDIYGVYWTGSELYSVPLIKDGIVDNSSRSSGEGGQTETFNGVCRGGRFDGAKITAIFPPGHGLHRGRVARHVMGLLGEDQFNFEDGAQMYKELQLVDTEPLHTLVEIMETENRRLLWSADGYCTNPKVGSIESDEQIQMTFEEKDLLRIETVSIDPQANVITLVVANGTQQEVEEECEERVEVVVNLKVGDYTPKAALFRLDPASLHPHEDEYTAMPEAVSPSEPIVVSKTETTRKYRCDQLYEEIVVEWGWKNPQVYRYTWDASHGDEAEHHWHARPASYTDDEDGFGGGAAYLYPVEKFLMLSHKRTLWFFRHEEFIGDLGGNNTPLNRYFYDDTRNFGMGPGGYAADTRYGQFCGTVTIIHSMNRLFGAIKSKNYAAYPQDKYEDIPPTPDVKIWGDTAGVGEFGFLDSTMVSIPGPPVNVQDGIESLMLFSMTVHVFTGNEDNKLTQEVEYIHGHRARRGSGYFFGDNDYRMEASEKFRIVDINTTKYSATGKTHSEDRIFYDAVLNKTRTESDTGLAGGLPAIEMLDFVTPATDIYEEGDEENSEANELPKSTRRHKTKTLTVTVPYDFLLTCHLPKEVVTEFPWAENMEELRELARFLVEESAAMPVRFTLPANFMIREAMPIHLTYRPLAIDHDMRVKSVNWTQTYNSPLLTRVEARLYPF